MKNGVLSVYEWALTEILLEGGKIKNYNKKRPFKKPKNFN